MGVGASAGGLLALDRMLSATPPDCALAFVVIQHQAPSAENHLADLLTRRTALGVSTIEDGVRAVAGHVYCPPPGRYVTVEHGRLRLRPQLLADGRGLPIDFFFEALAADQGHRAVGVLLSGSSAFDGLRGLTALHNAGALCIAQSPASAEFGALPAAAIDSGLAAMVAPAEQIVAAIVARTAESHPDGPRPTPSDRPVVDAVKALPEPPDVSEILELLHVGVGTDYRHYKAATVLRRIDRRRAMRGIPTVKGYAAVLRNEPDELKRLSDDMLIAVSGFFRDPEAFETLRLAVIAPLVANAPSGGTLRIWVPGCATGEEAYSLLMLCVEEIEAAGKNVSLQVFASDADGESLAIGRRGIYPDSALQNVSPKRIERFFSRERGGLEVRQQLRQSVVFARHNLLRDAPFSKLDLLSCRNLLIYLDPAIQREVVSLFAFALNPGGYLFLGRSEGGSSLDPMFETVAEDARIYRRRPGSAPIAHRHRLETGPLAPQPTLATRTRRGAQVINQRVLLEHFRAAVLITDVQGDIHHFFGPAERYLTHPHGLASLNVLQLLPGAIAVKLRRALTQVAHHHTPIAFEHLRPDPDNPRDRAFRVTVRHVPVEPGEAGMLAVFFEDAQARVAGPLGTAVPGGDGDAGDDRALSVRAGGLQQQYNSLLADFETARDEREATAEQFLSVQAEFQIVTEELEGSREELQSINEELNTSDSQLLDRVAELTRLNDDLSNFRRATRAATVFLDTRRRLRRCTAVGDDASQVLRSLVPIEREVVTRDDHWYTMRVGPYRMADDTVAGVVVTLLNIDRLKAIERQARDDQQLAARRGQQLRALVSDMALIEERERRRIAALLHDDLQQLLLGVRLSVERLQDRFDDAASQAVLVSLLDTVEQAIAITRSFAAGLYPPVLYSGGLVAATRWLARKHQRTAAAAVSVVADDDVATLVSGHQVILFQCVSELLLNVAKHADARNVEIQLRSGSDGVVRVTVADDGTGFDVAALAVDADPPGVGLLGLRDRMAALGGRMIVESEPGQGTRVTLEVPAEAEAPDG